MRRRGRLWNSGVRRGSPRQQAMAETRQLMESTAVPHWRRTRNPDRPPTDDPHRTRAATSVALAMLLPLDRPGQVLQGRDTGQETVGTPARRHEAGESLE